MSEMEPLFQEMIDTLRGARQAVGSELEALAAAQYVDRRSLVVLDGSVRGFAAQADALVVMMTERDAPDDLVDAAEELVDFFQGARERIETMLTLGHG